MFLKLLIFRDFYSKLYFEVVFDLNKPEDCT